MTTSSLYPTTVASTVNTTWATTTNATGSTSGDYATWTNASKSTTGSIQLSGYAAQTAINPGTSFVTVNSVAVTVKFYFSTTTPISSASVQLYSGTTAIGTATALTLSTTTTNSQTVTMTGANCPTWAQLADLQAKVSATRGNSTTSAVLNLDYVGVVITYTLAPNNYVAGSAVTASTATSVANSTWTLTATITPSAGDLLVMKTASGGSSVTATAVSDGINSWSQTVPGMITSLYAYADIWTAVATSATTITVTVTFTNTNNSVIIPTGICLERYTGVMIGLTPGTATAQNTTAQGTITATQANSTITWVDADYNGVTGTAAYLGSDAQTGTPYQNSGNASFYFGQHTAPAAGSQSFGVTAPTGQKSSLTALELVPYVAPPTSSYVYGSAAIAMRQYSVASGSWSLTTNITPAVGDILVLKAGSGSSSVTVTSVSGGSLTWTNSVPSLITASNAFAGIWTATATSSSQIAVTVTFTNSSTGPGIPTGICIERYQGVVLAGTPAKATAQNTTAQSSLTATQAGSTITWIDSDFNGVTGAASYVSPATLTGYAIEYSANVSIYFGQQVAPATGATSFGVTAPTGQAATLAALELVAPAVKSAAFMPFFF